MNRVNVKLQETTCLHPEIEESMVQWLTTRTHPAFLIIGQPGLGKTTLVYRVCERMKYWVQEFNASHTRTGSSFRQVIYPLLTETGISNWIHPLTPNGRAILLDEMDGLSHGERGGFQELLDYLKSKRKFKQDCPLILICNVLEGRAMQYLHKYCLVHYIRMPAKDAIERWRNTQISDSLYNIGDLRKVYQATCYGHIEENEISETINENDNIHIALKAAWFTLFNKWMDNDELDLETKDANLTGLLFHQNLTLFFDKESDTAIYEKILESIRWSDRADFWAFFHQCWNLLPLSYRLKLKYPNTYIYDLKQPTNPPKPENLQYTQVLTKQSALFNSWKDMNKHSNELTIPFRCIAQWATYQKGKAKDTLGLLIIPPDNQSNSDIK